MDIKSGYFQSDGNAVNVILGFVPDFLILFNDTQDTGDPNIMLWSRAINASGLAGLEGWTDASTGDFAAAANAAAGIIPYDADASLYAMVNSPMPGKGKIATVVNEYATSTVWVARSGSVIGSIIIPSTRNGYVYECTTYSSADGTPEPTWLTVPGETVTEGTSTNVFTCRNYEAVRYGGKGFTFGGTDQSNSEHVAFIAFRTSKDRYIGDAADGDLSII